uniref:Dynein heavy chain linker domain-containing protein n=1 Tax=Monopterus albus TaxID=43700 RepID=A0A3Q3KD74_MONAL
MNYMSLKQWVARHPYTPIQQQWLDSIVSRVPSKLKDSPEKIKLLQELCMEVRNDFDNVIIKHTVDTVLKDPQIEETISEKQTVPQQKILDIAEPWHDSFIRNRKTIKSNLLILHPVMQTVLDIGYLTFSPLVLVDLTGLRASRPLDCKSIQNKMAVECKRTEDHIMNTWFPEVTKLLTSEQILEGVKKAKQDSFYNCASTLISNQLKSFLQRSVEEFVSLFDPSDHHCLPVFRMALTFDDEKMEIYPTVQDLEAAVASIEIYAIHPQRVQTAQSWRTKATSFFVDARVPDHVLAWAEVTVKTALEKNLEEPSKHFQSYVNSYDWLVNGTAQARVDRFIEEEHSFDEYTKQVEEFRALSKEIISLPAKARFTMVHLDCEELKQGLSNKAENYAEILLKKLISSHREQNLQICYEFKTIRERALKVPETREDMTEMTEYINFIKTKGIADSIIIHYHTPEDVELNSTVFLWPKTIRHVFELHDEITHGRFILETCCRFNCHIIIFWQYVMDVRTVQKLLQEAEETISFINKGEAFYNWDLTCFPEVELIKENIEPYQKLFGLVLKWQQTENRWMDGSFEGLDGESIDTKVDEFFREIFKMLKFFQQKQIKAEQEMENIHGKSRKQPSEDDARKPENLTIHLCSTVMEQIKEFKVFYIIILRLVVSGVLCDTKPLCEMCLVSTEPYPGSVCLL